MDKIYLELYNYYVLNYHEKAKRGLLPPQSLSDYLIRGEGNYAAEDYEHKLESYICQWWEEHDLMEHKPTSLAQVREINLRAGVV